MIILDNVLFKGYVVIDLVEVEICWCCSLIKKI